MPCFCNIEKPITENINDQVTIHSDVKNKRGAINSTASQKCDMVLNTPGSINLRHRNITTISVLEIYTKSLYRSTFINKVLDNNHIHVLAPSFTWLPKRKHTNSSQIVNIHTMILDRNGLTTVLAGAWLNLAFDHLSLPYNNLSNITDQTFVHLDVIKLSVSHNQIKHVSKLVFRYIKHLKKLVLSNNMIKQLSAEPFPLTLQQLALYYNFLTNLDFHYEYIMAVDLSNNNLTFIDIMTNKEPKYHLRRYNDNLIKIIKENAFQYISKIDLLDLSNNYFNLNISKTYFGRDFQCRILNLYNNKITSIRNIFNYVGLRKVKEIDLSYNYVTEVDFDNHHHMVSINKLYIAYNTITYISPNIFQNMNQLIYADFKGNNLHYLYFMPVMSEEVVVDFTYNPLHCSCHMKWLKEKALWHRYRVDFCTDLVSLRQVRVLDVPLYLYVTIYLMCFQIPVQ